MKKQKRAGKENPAPTPRNLPSDLTTKPTPGYDDPAKTPPGPVSPDPRESEEFKNPPKQKPT